jgi:spore maturation protein CgeB
VSGAGAVVVQTPLADGVEIGDWVNDVAEGVTVFLDADTPSTLGQVEEGRCAYLTRNLIARYDVYLSSAGGAALRRLKAHGSIAAHPFHAMVDSPNACRDRREPRWALGYLADRGGTRPVGVERLLIEAARRSPGLDMLMAGCSEPALGAPLPPNVTALAEIPLVQWVTHMRGQRFTLDPKRDDMSDPATTGWSPGAGLFHAAVCGVPVISEGWEGLCYFFEEGREILLASDADDVLRILHDTPDAEADRIAARAKLRVLGRHTSEHRASELEHHLADAASQRVSRDRPIGGERRAPFVSVAHAH